jgi:hypothetical protein
MLFLSAFYIPYIVLFAAMFVELKQETYCARCGVLSSTRLSELLSIQLSRQQWAVLVVGRLIVQPHVAVVGQKEGKGRDSASEPEGNSPPPERASSYLPSEWFESTALRSDIDSVGDGATGVAASATGDRETSSNEQELSMNFAS